MEQFLFNNAAVMHPKDANEMVNKAVCLFLLPYLSGYKTGFLSLYDDFK